MKRYIKPQTDTTAVNTFKSNQFVLENILFDKQLAFVQDQSPFKVAVCSRRAGKTISCAAHLIHTALSTPDVSCLYITLSSVSGKRIIWKDLKKFVKDYGVKCKINEIELSLTFENQSIVYLSGAKDTTEIEKFRGMAMKLVYIDECQSFRAYIKDLIDDIIGPALMDYNGTLCLIGTPGPVPTGYFHDCAVKNENWSKHHWTFFENPHIPIKAKVSHQVLFDREMKRRGIKDPVNDPSVQREWYGKWVLDADSLLIHYNADINDFNVLPQINAKWNYILGIDVGFNDADALAVLAWSDLSPHTYLVEELLVSKQGITELAAQIAVLQKRYDISKMIMDMGGLGKKIGEELSKRYLLPVEAADKVRKMENVELLNDALRTGHFKASAKSKFAEDSFLVEIDRDKSTPDRIKVSDFYHSDIIDAVLYAFKFSPAYSYEPPKAPKPKWGTQEWAEDQVDEMFSAELDYQHRLQNMKKEWE